MSNQQQIQSDVAQDDIAGREDTISPLVQSIKTNTDIIIDCIETILPTLRDGQVIVIGYGETHASCGHITLATNVIHELAQRNIKTAFAAEWPINNIDLHIDDVAADKTDNEGLKAVLQDADHARLRDKLSADTVPIRTKDARLNRTVLHQYMDNHNIPVFCVDAQRDWKKYIDNDRKTQHLLADDPDTLVSVFGAGAIIGGDTKDTDFTNIDALSRHGMTARNLYTMLSIEKIAENNPDLKVIFVQEGLFHITGNDAAQPEAFPYKETLSALFNERSGHTYIPAPVYTTAENKISQNTAEMLSNQKSLDLLYLENNFCNLNDIYSDDKESKYLTAISAHFDWVNETLDDFTPNELRTKREKELLNKLADIHHDHDLGQ